MRSTTVAVLIAILAVSSAFAPVAPVHRATAQAQRPTRLAMFNADGDDATTIAKPAAPSTTTEAAKPLQEETTAKPLESTITNEATTTVTSAPKMTAKNIAKGEEIELNFYDPAMGANTNPFQMEWWAYILVGYPFILLLNDAFHFLPSGGFWDAVKLV